MPILRWPPDAESLSRTNPDLLFQKEVSPAHSFSPEAEALAGRGGHGSGLCREGPSPLTTLSHNQCPAKRDSSGFPLGASRVDSGWFSGPLRSRFPAVPRTPLHKSHLQGMLVGWGSQRTPQARGNLADPRASVYTETLQGVGGGWEGWGSHYKQTETPCVVGCLTHTHL